MFHGSRRSDCKIATDDFNRADNDSLGANWAEESGDSDISDDELLFVTSPAIVIFQTNHPGGADAPRRVRVRFKMPNGGGLLQVFAAWADADDRVEAIVKSDTTCHELNLVKYEGGTQTYLNPDGTATGSQIVGDGIPDDEWHTLEVCMEKGTYPYASDILRVKLTLASGKVYGTQYLGSLAGGLKVGLQGSPNVRVDDFYFGWMKDDVACKRNCPDCMTPCLIESDSFPDGSETPCKWDSGKFRVFHPQLGTRHYAAATFILASGQNAEVRVNMKVDGSEYHWAKLALSGSTVTLTIGKNGTTLQTKTGTGTAGGYTLTVCYDNGVLTGTGGPLTGAKGSSKVADGIYAGRAGSATFTSFQFQKHFAPGDDDKCPNCPEPPADCSCCTDPQPVFSYIVDLGGPTLTNHCCSDCALIAGEYLLALRNPCDWFHIEGLCGGTSTCGGCACLGVTLRVESVVSNVSCKWQVDFNFSDDPGFGGSRCGCSPPHPNGFFARYESAAFPNVECGVMPRTLTKVSESFGPGPDLLCDGNMPSSATLRAAA